MGCALAFVAYAGFTKSWNYWLATPCFLLLFYAIIFDLDKRFWLRDGGAVVVALAAAGLFWGLASPGEWGLLRRGLASGPLVWAGKISYGLYVWHLPIYCLIARQQPAWPLFYLVVVKIAGTVVVATLSYYYVERPIQRWAKRRTKAHRDMVASGGT